MKKTPPHQPATREVVELTKAEHAALKKKLSLFGALKKMQTATKLASQTIRNVRDFGRGERPTVEKVREYMSGKLDMAEAV